jgi:hypothetical protein
VKKIALHFIFFGLTFCLFVARPACAWQTHTGSTPFPTSAAQWHFETAPNLRLQDARSGKESLPLRDLQLVVRNGKTQQSLVLPAPKVQQEADALSALQNANGLQIAQKIQPLSTQKNALLWTIDFANPGADEIWIEAGLRGEIGSATNLKFWDGYDFKKAGAGKWTRSTPDLAFPATMLQSDSQKSAMVVALHPDNDLSWMTTFLDPQKREYFYGARIAIPVAEKISLKFVLFVLQPHFGERDAVDNYYQRFPASFRAAPGTDPRLTDFRGINSSYVARHVISGTNQTPKLSTIAGLEKLRASWEWGYNTYKFSGDWFGRAESWELPLTQGDNTSLDEFQKTSSFDLKNIEQFHRDRIALYKNSDLRANIEMSFYLLNFVQAELAQKNDWMPYTYGYFRADDAASGRIKHWVSSYDDTWHIFPWASPFEDLHRRDLPALLKELNTSSFAIDVYADSSPYRGPTIKPISGWSYDEKGRFINTGLANKKLVEFMHTLRGENFRAAAVVNLSPWEQDPALKIQDKNKVIPNFSTIFAPDAYAVEGDVSNLVDYDQPGRLFPKRYLFGKKYISSVSGAYQDEVGERIPWATMSPNQIRAAYKKYLKTRLMAYYQGGILPNYDDARGIDFLIREIPHLLEIQARGFCAAPALEGDEKLQRRRYGDDLGAAIVVSNPTPDGATSRETLLSNYFKSAPDSVVLPFDDGGQKLDFETAPQSHDTKFLLTVASMENRALLAPLAVRLAVPQALTGSTHFTGDAHQQIYDVTINVAQTSNGSLMLKAPRDFILGEVSLNGKSGVANKNDFSSPLKKGENRLRVVFNSTQFLSPEKQLRDFDWKNFQISLPVNAGEREKSAAQILADYATFYHKFAPEIKAQNALDATAKKATIAVATGEEKRGIGFGGAGPGVLRIGGADDFDTQQLAWRLARLLDSTEEQMPAATFTHPSTKAMLDRIGLMTNAEKSHVAKPITLQSLAPVAGEDAVSAGGADGKIGELDFTRVLPLPRDGWTATASSSYVDPGNPIAPEKVLDDVAGTRWTPGRGKSGAWIVVDMRQIREFNHVRLVSPYPYKYFPRHYKVELSDDGEKWREAASGEGAKDTDIYWPQLQKARFIRISLTENQDEFWSIDELLVFQRVLPKATGAPALETLPQLQVPKRVGQILLDGKLDESVWREAVLLADFTALKKHPVTQPTTTRIFHDGQAFYLGIVCREANMDKIWEPTTQRDGAVWSGDDLEIYLAPGDGGGQLKFPYFQFLFSPSAVQADLKFDQNGKGDLEWNGNWQVKTFKAADFWSAEVRIPFTDLGDEKTQVFRANIGRLETPNGDTTTWAPMQNIFAQPHLFGVWHLGN